MPVPWSAERGLESCCVPELRCGGRPDPGGGWDRPLAVLSCGEAVGALGVLLIGGHCSLRA
eukprot:scaffold294400_cov30-Tisochrysis_lutea.AAC.1